MTKGKVNIEQLKEFWKHNIHPITGYRATVFRTAPYIRKSERTNN